MKKKLYRISALVLALAMFTLLLSGCAKNDVKKTISNFESACQALDVKGMFECIDPTVSTPVLSAMELLGVEDTSNLLNELVDLLGIFEGAGESTETFVQSIKITPNEFAFNADKDECTVTAELSYGKENTQDITIELILEDEIWYISGIEF